MEPAFPGASSKGGRLTSITCAIASPFVLYLVAHVAAGGNSLAVSLPPANHDLAIRQVAIAAAKDPKTKIDQPGIDLARRAALAAPLAYAPFFVSGLAAEQRGDRDRALVLMEKARQRRPEWLPIRYQLIALYFRSDRLVDLGREIDYVLRIDERARMTLLPELVKLLKIPDGRRYVATILARNPPWKDDFYTVAGAQGLAPADALDLLRLAATHSRDVSKEEGLYVSSLLTAGRSDLARARWLASLPQAEQAQHRLLFNGNFRSALPGGAFGWTLHSLDVGRADIVAAGDGRSVLRAQYFGGTSAVLAEQRIALAPGRYRLQVTGRDGGSAPAGQMAWSIGCSSGGPELRRLPVSGLTTQGGTTALNFTVPGGNCLGQTLRLAATPGDMASSTEAEFSSIEISNDR